MIIRKGTTFHGPDGQGYRATRDLQSGDFITAETLEPLGGAPNPKAGEPIPPWLAVQLGPRQ